MSEAINVLLTERQAQIIRAVLYGSTYREDVSLYESLKTVPYSISASQLGEQIGQMIGNEYYMEGYHTGYGEGYADAEGNPDAHY